MTRWQPFPTIFQSVVFLLGVFSAGSSCSPVKSSPLQRSASAPPDLDDLKSHPIDIMTTASSSRNSDESDQSGMSSRNPSRVSFQSPRSIDALIAKCPSVSYQEWDNMCRASFQDHSYLYQAVDIFNKEFAPHISSKEAWAQALAMHIAYLDIFKSTAAPESPWELVNAVTSSYFGADLTFASRYTLAAEEIGAKDLTHLGMKAQLWVPKDPEDHGMNIILFRGTHRTPTKMSKLLALGSGMEMNKDKMGQNTFHNFAPVFTEWILNSKADERGLFITGHSLGGALAMRTHLLCHTLDDEWASENVETMIFNSAGMDKRTSRSLNRSPRLYHIRNRGDWIPDFYLPFFELKQPELPESNVMLASYVDTSIPAERSHNKAAHRHFWNPHSHPALLYEEIRRSASPPCPPPAIIPSRQADIYDSSVLRLEMANEVNVIPLPHRGAPAFPRRRGALVLQEPRRALSSGLVHHRITKRLEQQSGPRTGSRFGKRNMDQNGHSCDENAMDIACIARKEGLDPTEVARLFDGGFAFTM